jgi:transposase-like protein
MDSHARSYHRYRFSPLIISHAVWLYHRFCLSFRDAENLLAQRGITVSYETIRQWCLTFGPEYARTLRRRRRLSVRAWGFNGASRESPVLRAVHSVRGQDLRRPV